MLYVTVDEHYSKKIVKKGILVDTVKHRQSNYNKIIEGLWMGMNQVI